tara:strand:+ start:1369 stop:1761 length:393 start_codon:yes stop_codon:yes gene_type:complete
MADENGQANREQYTKPAERRWDSFHIDEFGPVVLRSLTEGEKTKFEMSVMESGGKDYRKRLATARRRLIILTSCDVVGGRPLLELKDEPLLQSMDGLHSQIIFDRAQTLCGFEAGDIEDTIKNCDPIPVG